jgi:2-polyprenyl-6-methoxyphenol hydroxylase-like FAD-dependent oxidoreductase
MSDALRDAELLAHAVVAGTDEALAAYQAARDSFAVEFLDLSDEIASFDWDLERAKALHHQLSKLMGREEDLIRSLDGGGPVDWVRPLPSVA